MSGKGGQDDEVIVVSSDDEDLPAPAVPRRHKRGASVNHEVFVISDSEDATPESTHHNNEGPAPPCRAVPSGGMDDAASPVRRITGGKKNPPKKRRTAPSEQEFDGMQQQQQHYPSTPPTEHPGPAQASQSQAGSGNQQQQHNGKGPQPPQQLDQQQRKLQPGPSSQQQDSSKHQQQPATSSSNTLQPAPAAAKQSSGGKARELFNQPAPRPAAAAGGGVARSPAAAPQTEPGSHRPPHPPHHHRQQQQQQQQEQEVLYAYGTLAQELSQHKPADFEDRRQRSLLRGMIQGVQLQVEEDREQLVDPHQQVQVAAMSALVDDTEQLGRLAGGKTRESVAHAGLLSTVAATSVTMARNATAASQQRRPADFVAALLRRYGPEGARHNPAAAGGDVVGITHHFAWAALGEAALGALPGLRPAPGLDTMMGPLTMEAKLRRKAQRAAQRGPPEALVRPVEDKAQELQEQHATDAIVADMLRVLRSLPGGSSPLLELVINTHPTAGFAQTVENLFALSFLVKDARVSLAKDPQQDLLVTLVSEAARKKHVADAAQHRGGAGHQVMLSLNMDDWDVMCELASAAHMPHREPAAH